MELNRAGMFQSRGPENAIPAADRTVCIQVALLLAECSCSVRSTMNSIIDDAAHDASEGEHAS